MYTSSRNYRIILIIGALLGVLLVGWVVFSFFGDADMSEQGSEGVGGTGNSSFIITSTTSVSADLDAYINSPNKVPDATEFNDSFSDLNL